MITDLIRRCKMTEQQPPETMTKVVRATGVGLASLAGLSTLVAMTVWGFGGKGAAGCGVLVALVGVYIWNKVVVGRMTCILASLSLVSFALLMSGIAVYPMIPAGSSVDPEQDVLLLNSLGSLAPVQYENSTTDCIVITYTDELGGKIAAKRGRGISENDNGKQVCCLSPSLASKLFPYTDPLGKTVRLSDNRYFRIIGVCELAGELELKSDQKPFLYIFVAPTQNGG